MSRLHSTLLALLVGAAATAGTYAAVRTVHLGQAAAKPLVSTHLVAARQHKLAAWNRSLHAALAKRPPKLPKLPHFAPVPAPAPAAPVAPAAAPPPVTYVRTPAVVTYRHAPATTPTSTSSSDDTSSDDNSGDDGSGDGGGD